MKAKINVFIGGDLSYKNIIITFLESSYDFELTEQFERADLIYWVYGNGPDLSKNIKFWLVSKKKIILHWIGTDVLRHISKIKSKNLKSLIYYRLWNYLIKRKVEKGDMINLCCAPWLIEELNNVGLNPKYVPITTINTSMHYDISIKRKFDFMSYIPQHSFDFYGGNLIFKLAEELKEFSFQILIPDIASFEEFSAYYPIPKNVTLLSRIEPLNMHKYYKKSKCFLRFTKHDGLSLSVIEALFNQLQVLWKYKLPTVTQIELKNIAALKEVMISTIRNWQPNFEGQKFVRDELNLIEATEKFKIAIKEDKEL